MYKIIVYGDNCEHCFDCVTACPREVFEEGEAFPRVARAEECMGCGVCLVVCRVNGLEVLELPNMSPVKWCGSVGPASPLPQPSRATAHHAGVAR